MKVLAIDPGPEKSAVLLWDGTGHRTDSCESGLWSNASARGVVEQVGLANIIAIEMVACYGMPVGKEVFETCVFIGRLLEAAKMPTRLVYRKDVKMHLCHSMRAKDANIRQALIDKHGAPGTKKAPGKTYGISGHLWAALAIADYVMDNPA